MILHSLENIVQISLIDIHSILQGHLVETENKNMYVDVLKIINCRWLKDKLYIINSYCVSKLQAKCLMLRPENKTVWHHKCKFIYVANESLDSRGIKGKQKSNPEQNHPLSFLIIHKMKYILLCTNRIHKPWCLILIWYILPAKFSAIIVAGSLHFKLSAQYIHVHSVDNTTI